MSCGVGRSLVVLHVGALGRREKGEGRREKGEGTRRDFIFEISDWRGKKKEGAIKAPSHLTT